MPEAVTPPAAVETPPAPAAPQTPPPATPPVEPKPAAPEAPKTPPAEPPKAEPKQDDKPADKPPGEDSILDDGAAKADSPETPSEAKVVPEKYELKLPENSPLDAAQLEQIATLAKERGYSQEEAQRYLEDKSQAVTEYRDAQNNQLMTMSNTWLGELQSDPEVGGAHLAENGRLAYRAGKEIFGDEFLAHAKAMKVNHHPLFFKGLVKLGKLMGDGKLVVGGGAPKVELTREEKYYGKVES